MSLTPTRKLRRVLFAGSLLSAFATIGCGYLGIKTLGIADTTETSWRLNHRGTPEVAKCPDCAELQRSASTYLRLTLAAGALGVGLLGLGQLSGRQTADP
ncbi:MAG: hypothetical protein AB7K71_10165 [Polyangiaceae bacterium]